MRILAVLSAMDLQEKMGCTPAWHEILKELASHAEIIATPYIGNSIKCDYWKSKKNPNLIVSSFGKKIASIKNKPIGAHNLIKNGFQKTFPNKSKLYDFFNKIISYQVIIAWKKHLYQIINQYRIDSIIYFSIPLNHLQNLPTEINDEFHVNQYFYEGDMPIILPKYFPLSQLSLNYLFPDCFLPFKCVFTNSLGGKSDLKAFGAKKVIPIPYGSIIRKNPLTNEFIFDIFFYGHGAQFREKWIKQMIITPSKKLKNMIFLIGGWDIKPIRNIQVKAKIPYADYLTLAQHSRINLNITRKHHATFYGASTARLFELSGLGTAVVSNPIDGLEKWFKIGKEILVANSGEEFSEIYQNLYDDPERRNELAFRIQERSEKEHTYSHRARIMLKEMEK